MTPGHQGVYVYKIRLFSNTSKYFENFTVHRACAPRSQKARILKVVLITKRGGMRMK